MLKVTDIVSIHSFWHFSMAQRNQLSKQAHVKCATDSEQKLKWVRMIWNTALWLTKRHCIMKLSKFLDTSHMTVCHAPINMNHTGASAHHWSNFYTIAQLWISQPSSTTYVLQVHKNWHNTQISNAHNNLHKWLQVPDGRLLHETSSKSCHTHGCRHSLLCFRDPLRCGNEKRWHGTAIAQCEKTGDVGSNTVTKYVTTFFRDSSTNKGMCIF